MVYDADNKTKRGESRQAMTKKLLMGNEAFAHAALEAGVRVVAGYPGTPSSELIETVAKLHAEGRAHGVHVEWSTDEKAALELLAGASYAGARCLFTCKQVGLNVASDALMSLNYVGVKGGLVLFVADDPGPISSQTEQDTRRFGDFAKVPVLDPTTPEEGFAMMKEAFDLSERYGTPVIVRPTTRICHASTFFEVADETQARPLPEEGFVKDPKWVIFPRRAWEGHGEITARLNKMGDEFCEGGLSQFNTVVEVASGGSFDQVTVLPGAKFVAAKGAEDSLDDMLEREDQKRSSAEGVDAPIVGIVAGGVSAAYAREALRMLEELQKDAGCALPAYRFLQVGTPFPFPEKLARIFLRGLRAVWCWKSWTTCWKMGSSASLGARICAAMSSAARPARCVTGGRTLSTTSCPPSRTSSLPSSAPISSVRPSRRPCSAICRCPRVLPCCARGVRIAVASTR